MPRPTQDPKIKIDEILETAEPLFYAQGYRKTTIRGIAKKMGVAQGMLYYYFNSKEAILEALLNRKLSLMLSQIEHQVYSDNINPPQKIELIVTEMFQTQYINDPLFDLMIEARLLHIKMVSQVILFLKPLLLKVIKEGIEKKCFHVSSPQVAVSFLMSILKCIGETLPEKLPDELMTAHLQMAEVLIEKVLLLPEDTLHLALKK